METKQSINTFECPKSCNNACCRNVKHLLVTPIDVARWVENNNQDVLALLRVAEVSVEDTKFVALILLLDKKCPFLKRKQCSIYDVRPTACKMFPFKTTGLPYNAISTVKWAKEICPVHDKYNPPYEPGTYKKAERMFGITITFQDVLTKVIGKQRKKLVIDAKDLRT